MLQGTRDYNVGDGADVSVQAAAQQMGLQLPETFQARQINPEKDIVCFDIVLVMDKFTAADVLREVSTHRCQLKLRHTNLQVKQGTQSMYTCDLCCSLIERQSLKYRKCVGHIQRIKIVWVIFSVWSSACLVIAFRRATGSFHTIACTTMLVHDSVSGAVDSACCAGKCI